MTMEGSVFPVSGGHPQAIADGDLIRSARTPQGFEINMPWVQAYINAGHAYHVQFGAENAPIDGTAVDDTTVQALIDVPADLVVIPYRVECVVVNWTTATLAEAMIEVDNAKVRYSSGGTAFTPLNLNTVNPQTLPSGVVAYVGPDITAAAKTSGGSIEVARQQFSEDAIATATPSHFNKFVWEGPSPVVGDAASFLVHFGSATADIKGYGSISFIAMTKAQFIRT